MNFIASLLVAATLSPTIVDGLICLPPAEMNQLVDRIELIEKQTAVIESQESLITLQREQIATATTAIGEERKLTALERSRADEYRSLAERLQTRISELESPLRSPILWGVIGGAAGFVLRPLFTPNSGADITVVK